MKTTLDLPDPLYRQVKAKAATDGRSVREVTIELYEFWLAGKLRTSGPSDAVAWLDEWVRFGADLDRKAPAGPTAREILEQGRNRLEPK